jgi:hypothetical protein
VGPDVWKMSLSSWTMSKQMFSCHKVATQILFCSHGMVLGAGDEEESGQGESEDEDVDEGVNEDNDDDAN